ncbi:tetratricopeptide repeat protein [Argonema antarcticum]|uniref:tetratricopeptide repeat protein n=1 Tax=Argonema antarcticum TaxID=2942763 RepID=UPI002012DBA0|nr:tetratricopeptide repeat protein [Argonema antarcticum]MCL1471448.1 tetratricopeptide repeat protein [Argonema antarcticum A004/B2]
MQFTIKILALISLLVSVQAPLSLNFSASLFTNPVQAKTVQERQAEADRLQQQGFEEGLKNRQFEAALESWQKALTIYREIKDRRGEGRSLGNIGYAYFLLDDREKAIEYLEQDLAIARDIKDRQEEADALGNLGTVYYSQGDYPKAIDYYQKSLAIQRQLKNSRGEALCLNNLVSAYRYLGEYAKATESEQQSFAIANTQQETSSTTRLWQQFKIVERYGNL